MMYTPDMWYRLFVLTGIYLFILAIMQGMTWLAKRNRDHDIYQMIASLRAVMTAIFVPFWSAIIFGDYSVTAAVSVLVPAWYLTIELPKKRLPMWYRLLVQLSFGMIMCIAAGSIVDGADFAMLTAFLPLLWFGHELAKPNMAIK